MTTNCIKSIFDTNQNNSYNFIIVDAGSTDDTKYKIEELKNIGINIKFFTRKGYYYSQGMRAGMIAARKQKNADYVLLMNDDVILIDSSIDQMIEEEYIQWRGESVLVGACKNKARP